MSLNNAVLALTPPSARRLLRRIRASSLGYRLARGIAWSLLGSVIARGLGLASSVAVARMLGKTGFGELGIIQSTVGMFGVFAGFGLGATATKYVAEYRNTDPAKAGRVLALSSIVAIVTGGLTALSLFAVAPWLASRTLAAPHLAGLLRIGSLFLFLSAMNGAQAGALSGFEAFRAIAARSLWAGIITFPLMVGGTYLAGIHGAVWGLVCGMGVNCFLNHLSLKSESRKAGVPLALGGCLAELPVVWQFSLPAFLGGAMTGPVTWACGALLVNRPGGYAEMGLYNASYAFHNMMLMIGSMVGAPLLPMLANLGSKASQRFGQLNMLITWGLGTVPALILLCFPEIGQMIYGAEFQGAEFTRTLALVVLFTSIVMYKQGMARALQAHGLMWWGFLSNSVWAAVLLLSALYLVRWGAVGLAGAYVIAYVVNTLVFIPLYTSRRLVPRGTILSAEAALVWAVIVFCALGALLGWPLYLRAPLCPIALTLVAGALLRLLRSAGKVAANG